MAVFTSVTLDEVNAWLEKNYRVGTASELKGISSGIENSNFFLTTQMGGTQREFVLTLFERLSKEQLPYYLELMEHLSKKGIKVPAPLRNNAHQIVGDLNGKPATIVTKLSGKSFLNPSVRHCATPWPKCIWQVLTSSSLKQTCAALIGGKVPCLWSFLI